MDREKLILTLNQKLNGTYGTIEELEESLTYMFEDALEEHEDAQEAFNYLNDVIGENILSSYFCYMLSDGGEWDIECKNFTEEMLMAFYHIGWDIQSVEELESAIVSKVMKTESNVGCDAKTALNLEMEDFPSGYNWEDFISICIPEGNPAIKFIDNI